MAEGFTTPVDIGNRALQACGSPRITAFTDDDKGASAVAFAYDKARQAELRRNVWRFSIRKAALRAIDDTTMALIPGTYNPAKTYPVGSIVTYLGVVYYSQTAVALATPPDANPLTWVVYFGPLTVQPWQVLTPPTAYYSGELVYVLAGTVATVYMSLTSDNTDDPTVIAAWDATVTYRKGQTVTYLTVIYESAQDLNLNQTPPAIWAVGTTYAMSAVVLATDGHTYSSVAGGNVGHNPVGDAGVHWTDLGVSPWRSIPATEADTYQGRKWLKLDATMSALAFVYPIGAGPRNQSSTRNVFRLPNGYLKEAPQDPKSGSASYLGGPSGTAYDDWEFEGDYLVTRDQQVIVFRFVADIANVLEMDAMFCEGLGARIGLEVCEELTQSREKIETIGAQYKTFMSEARMVNGIENGATEPPTDDYISCRT